MRRVGSASKDLLLLVSLFLLGVLFLSIVIVSSILGIPLQNIDIRDGKVVTVNQSNTEALQDEQENSTKCSVQFLPPQWGFSMHIIMYLWATVAIVFLISNVFRMARDGKAYCSPPIFTLLACTTTNLSFLFYLIWMILWKENQWTASVCLIFLATICSWASVVIFSLNLYAETEYLHHFGSVDLWLYRVAVQNSLGIQATWFLCLTLVSFSTAVSTSTNEPTASEISIIFLTFLIAIYTPFDMMVFDKLSRYLLSPFLVLLWTISSIYNRLTGDDCHDATVRVYALVLVGLIAAVLIGRIFLTVFRHIRKPLAKNQ